MDSSAPQLTDIERLLLMAAAVQQHGPESDIDLATTAAIVLQVLKWSRPDYADIRRRWKQGEWPSEVDEVYEPLARMTQMQLRAGGYRPAERPGPALFEGSGNWGVPGDPECPPSDPRFNSCRLTAFGQQVANELLAAHPEYLDPGRREAGEEGGSSVAVTKYLYDGDTVLQEYDANGVTLTEYTSTRPGYGDLLSAYDGSAAKYFEPDALGSTGALTDQSQTVVDRWAYRAFGSATQTAGTDSTPFTWVGRLGYYADAETGLYLLGNGTRYYDPAVAQFLSEDPIEFAGGDPNTRRYVGNNPANRLDPAGLVCAITECAYQFLPGGNHAGATGRGGGFGGFPQVPPIAVIEDPAAGLALLISSPGALQAALALAAKANPFGPVSAAVLLTGAVGKIDCPLSPLGTELLLRIASGDLARLPVGNTALGQLPGYPEFVKGAAAKLTECMNYYWSGPRPMPIVPNFPGGGVGSWCKPLPGSIECKGVLASVGRLIGALESPKHRIREQAMGELEKLLRQVINSRDKNCFCALDKALQDGRNNGPNSDGVISGITQKIPVYVYLQSSCR